MSITLTQGDPLLTRAPVLAFGWNAAGRTEVGTLETALLTRYPAAFAAFRKQAHRGRIKAGTYWLWRDTQPKLMFVVLRETSVGAARIRHAEAALMALARDYRLEMLTGLALAPLGDEYEWSAIRPVVAHWLGSSPLSVVVYDRYLPGVDGEQG